MPHHRDFIVPAATTTRHIRILFGVACEDVTVLDTGRVEVREARNISLDFKCT
jgi:hypothetical protein